MPPPLVVEGLDVVEDRRSTHSTFSQLRKYGGHWLLGQGTGSGLQIAKRTGTGSLGSLTDDRVSLRLLYGWGHVKSLSQNFLRIDKLTANLPPLAYSSFSPTKPHILDTIPVAVLYIAC